ncbi:hypothetical protein C8R48DRAFT_675903 [Suillus tomentosus]|nr:hypothetical protein C8R48DRAFT_675903 [Suillus tomentosus]
MSNRPSQRKGKAAVPKPARGSGLNPSGLPAADQLNIPAEQPSVSAFGFNPHEDSMQRQSGGPDWHSFRGPTQYDDSHASSSTSFGAFAQPQQDNFTQSQPYDDSHASSSTSFGTFAQPQQDTFTQSQPNLSQPHYGTSYDGYVYNQDGFGDAGGQPYGSSSLSNPQPNPSQPHDDGTSYDGYPYDQDRFGDTGDQLYDGSSLGTLRAPQEGTHVHRTPLPPWIDEASDGGVGVIDRGTGFVPPATNLALLRQGEIPQEEVVHTQGPARTTKKRNTRPNLPGTPYLVPQAPRTTTEPQTRAATSSQAQTTALQIPVATKHSAPTLKTVRVSNDNINDAVKGGKVLIARVMFTKHAMTQKRKKCVTQFEDAIKDSMPRCLEANVVIENFITNAHRRQVSNTLSSIRGKIAQFARDGVFMSYKLFPPRGSTIAAAQTHRIAMVNKLIRGIDPLLFMHAYSVDEHGNITIDAKFQNAFIMAGVVRFVWCEGREAFLGASPLKAIKYVMASVGSGTHCALQEQHSAVITVDAFGGQHHEEKFKEIVQAFDDLTDEEKLELESYLQYVLDVGPSQAGNGESSSDSE